MAQERFNERALWWKVRLRRKQANGVYSSQLLSRNRAVFEKSSSDILCFGATRTLRGT